MTTHPEQWPALVYLDFVKKQTGLSQDTIYRLIRMKRFPQGVRVGMRRTAWHAQEIWDYIENLPKAPVKGRMAGSNLPAE